MPTYEFKCDKCRKVFTVKLKLADYERKKFACPACKSKRLTQQISSFQTITSSKS